MLMLLPLLGVGGGLSVWARGAGCGPAAWCSECWQWGRVLKYVSSSIPDSEGWPSEPGPGPDTTNDTSDTCAKVSQCSDQARWRQQKRRKCFVMWNLMQ